MDTALSILVIRIAAAVYLAAGVGFLVNGDHYRKIWEDMFKNAAVMYFGGFMALIIGFILVTYHNLWVADWRVLVTILGWLALIKGISLIAFPRVTLALFSPLIKKKKLAPFGVAVILLGLALGYFAFIANPLF